MSDRRSRRSLRQTTGMIPGLRQPDMTETPRNRMIMEKIFEQKRAKPAHWLAESTRALRSRRRTMTGFRVWCVPPWTGCLILPPAWPTSWRLGRPCSRKGGLPPTLCVWAAIWSTGTRHWERCGRQRLVYPDEADISQGKISVLTPIGVALIGLDVGDSRSPRETRNGTWSWPAEDSGRPGMPLKASGSRGLAAGIVRGSVKERWACQ